MYSVRQIWKKKEKSRLKGNKKATKKSVGCATDFSHETLYCLFLLSQLLPYQVIEFFRRIQKETFVNGDGHGHTTKAFQGLC